MDLTFGKRSNNQQRSGAGGEFEMYLKTFKDGQNQITVLDDDPENWSKYCEHYDHSAKISYPCAIYEGGQECIGCSYPVQHEEWANLDEAFPDKSFQEAKAERKKLDPGWGVRDAPPKWIVPMIDPKGYVSLFKIGSGVRDDFRAQKAVKNTIMANEWIVLRSGTGFDTKYKLIQSDEPLRQAKYAVPGEAEISALLGKRYHDALESYGYDVGELTASPDPAPVQVPDKTGDLAADVLAGHIAQAQANGVSTTVDFIPREASVGEVKDWLSEHKVEFPPKAARQVLVSLAEKILQDAAPF